MKIDIESAPEALRTNMAENGIKIGVEIIPDGKIHRFAPTGSPRGKKHAWYVMFSDGIPAGAYGDWRDGVWHRWCFRNIRSFAPREKHDFRKKMKAAIELRKQEMEKNYSEAKITAKYLWREASACLEHQYLIDKQVCSYGLKTRMDSLIVPLFNSDGEMQSIQFIDVAGAKRFMQGGQVKGGYYTIEGDGSKIMICEGYATGATLREVHGFTVVVAFNAGNLLHVAKTIRKKYPQHKIVICADNDEETDGNPGITKAKAAAQAVGAKCVWPPISGDFNDWYTGDRND